MLLGHALGLVVEPCLAKVPKAKKPQDVGFGVLKRWRSPGGSQPSHARAPPRAALAGGSRPHSLPLAPYSVRLHGCRAARQRKSQPGGAAALVSQRCSSRCSRRGACVTGPPLLQKCLSSAVDCFTFYKHSYKQALTHNGLHALQDTGHGRRPLRPAATAAHRVPWRRGKPSFKRQ